ncbi:hypothetical protein FY145_01195 [Agrobacterium tumefaciens]|uniref:hypothetical protein n=1 Tax=Agrobacterium tumefaciens TaxID=358 RepID=UPI0021D33396|nr:hypothetical protein [Agrobacterium tumefaciens]UXS69187.1 hypothetical protein FY146_01195 [Agrobacterium tumefaciens]UXS76850.1 hypothetical protein FY145_01195 [Agrobacterium tumefaciens]
MTEQMTRADRDTLVKIARQRERVAKSEAKARAAQLMADFEKQLDTRYHYDQNEIWAESVKAAKIAIDEAKAKVAAECERLGIPKEFAPDINLGWRESGRQATKEERAEMRRVATRTVDAMLKAASTAIERRSLETQEKIMVGGLTTEDARQFLESMPTAESLMPALEVDSVKTLLLEEKRT